MNDDNVCWGYVINVHDPLNYDIDIYLSSDDEIKYKGVIQHKYTFTDNYSSEQNENKDETRITYRCRLKGIGRHTDNKDKNARQYRELKISIIKIINMHGGWVLVRPFEVDSYKRLLVELYDPVTKKFIYNINTDNKYKHLFYNYRK